MYRHNPHNSSAPVPMSIAEITAKLDVEGLRAKGHRVHVQGCSVTLDTGLEEGMQWLAATLALPNAGRHPTGSDAIAAAAGDPPSQEMGAQEQLLHEWLERHDAPDDVFLQQFNTYTLDKWDHYTHLRIAWLLLTRHGRKQGMELIFGGIRSFIENSPHTQRKDTGRGTTFHQTMTYFWAHMVHFCIERMQAQYSFLSREMLDKYAPGHSQRQQVAAEQEQAAQSAASADAGCSGMSAPELPPFKRFLLLNPVLSNGGYFLEFYSRERMLLDPTARSQVPYAPCTALRILQPALDNCRSCHL